MWQGEEETGSVIIVHSNISNILRSPKSKEAKCYDQALQELDNSTNPKSNNWKKKWIKNKRFIEKNRVSHKQGLWYLESTNQTSG